MDVENLGKLERRLSISVPLAELESEIDMRLKRLSRSVKMAGFRPGKVPLKIVAQQYGYQVQNEVLNEKIGGAFSKAVEENQLRVAGAPNIVPKKNENATAGAMDFDATFEIYPEVKIGTLEAAAVERAATNVDEAAIDKTLAILRKQRTHYHSKSHHAEADGAPMHPAPTGDDGSAKTGDQVAIDFTGTIDGEFFEGGSSKDFAFVLGENRMLPEFEAAVIGMKAGRTTTFTMTFPVDYHGREVAGKTAVFSVTVKDVAWAHVPELDAEFARALGVADGDAPPIGNHIDRRGLRIFKPHLAGLSLISGGAFATAASRRIPGPFSTGRQPN